MKITWSAVKKILFQYCFFVLVGILFLIGILFSVKLEIIAIILACGWCFNYLADHLIRKAKTLLASQERKRDRHQADWNAGLIADTPAERKDLKDEYDKVRSLDWALSRNIWLKHFVYVFAAYLVCMTVLFFGPGKIVSWSLDELFGVSKQEVIKLANTPFVQTGIQELSDTWDRGKKLFLQNLLIKEKNLGAEQYANVVKHATFSLNHVIDFAKQSPLAGDDLSSAINSYLNNLVISPTPAPPTVTLTGKNWWQQKREGQWLLLFFVEMIFTVVVLFYVAACVVATALQLLFSLGDEAWDQMKAAFATAMAKRTGTTTVAAASPTGTSAGTPTGEVWHSVLGSTIAEVLVKALWRTK